jgi:pseudouridine-5'-phosphate glycosidase
MSGPGPDCVALESTLLAHGVPREHAMALVCTLEAAIHRHRVRPAVVGVFRGQPRVGLTDAELRELLDTASLPKANTSNLGVLMHRGVSAATTVSTTMELAAAAGVRLFATGGLGGVHRGYSQRLDVSSDLAAFTRFPVAVVASGVKSILDVESTREVLETIGVPVIGYRTDRFPAFYLRESGARVDARFDDVLELAAFLKVELARAGRGVLVCNPIPAESAMQPEQLSAWLRQAEDESSGVSGRNVTPQVLSALHRVSGGATLRANVALVESNAGLAAALCRAMLD